MLRRDDSPVPGGDSKHKASKPNAAYKRPNYGIFLYLPDIVIPYAELMRLDRMSGFWAFWWHYLIGLAFALHLPSQQSSTRMTSSVNGLRTPLGICAMVLYLFIWTTVFRGLTCTWNDLLDAPFDGLVARTKFRPIARGAVGTNGALAFTLLQGLPCVILVAPLPPAATVHAFIMATMLIIYPFLKRVTDFPQVELGLGVSWAIFFTCAAMDRDLSTFDLQLPSNLNVHSISAVWLSGTPTLKAAFLLYLAGALWHITVDTVYAHQDHDDDRKAGVRSLAVFLGRGGTKPALIVCSIVQIACAIAAGYYAGFTTLYFVLACGGTACSLILMLAKLRLDEPESCAFWFGTGSKLVGVSMVAGLVGELFASNAAI